MSWGLIKDNLVASARFHNRFPSKVQTQLALFLVSSQSVISEHEVGI